MLTSLIAMMALQLSQGVNHFVSEAANIDAAVAIENPLHKPEDPSTMTLALIGAGTLAVYLGSRRAIRSRPQIDRVPSAAGLNSPEAAEQPSRGAA